MTSATFRKPGIAESAHEIIHCWQVVGRSKPGGMWFYQNLENKMLQEKRGGNGVYSRILQTVRKQS